MRTVQNDGHSPTFWVGANGKLQIPMMKTLKPAFRYINRGAENLFGKYLLFRTKHGKTNSRVLQQEKLTRSNLPLRTWCSSLLS